MSRTTPDNPGGPLTTFFTPPRGCFTNTPSTWSSCAYSTGKVSCIWTPPASCYPTNAYVRYQTYEGPPLTAVDGYHYSPGVLPLGFHTDFSSSAPTVGIAIRGCPSGWGVSIAEYTTGMCSMEATQWFQDPNKGLTSGAFTACIPHVQVGYRGSDLNNFTPVSAPSITGAALSRYEPAYLQSGAGATGTGQASSGSGSGSENTPPGEAGGGLSTGAEIGIGVGVGLVALILLGGLILFLVRRRRNKSRTEKIQHQDSKTAYLESKHKPQQDGDLKSDGAVVSELPDGGPQEMQADGNFRSELESRTGRPQPYEMGANELGRSELDSTTARRYELDPTSSQAPPVPFASKPRRELQEGYYQGNAAGVIRSPIELQGGWQGYEAADPRSPRY